MSDKTKLCLLNAADTALATLQWTLICALGFCIAIAGNMNVL